MVGVADSVSPLPGFFSLSLSLQDVAVNRIALAALVLSLWSSGSCVRAEATIDESPLAVQPVVAFPELTWTGWESDKDGVLNPLRPMLLTHAGDGSNRIFVPMQQGVVHVFKPDSTETKVFLDLSEKVHYFEKKNEEGFLGLAFHPRYKENGEFFVQYSTKEVPFTTILSRFRVSKDDPNKADPASEEELLRVTHPAWNHKAGTLCFGPDGYLYIAVGDGGKQHDPFNNGQNLQVLLGKILRIDVNAKTENPALNYAIPADNPFAEIAAEMAAKKRKGPPPRAEIFAYGVRNPWRMAFDRQTGLLWFADVGQDFWEEINIAEKGGNFGWSLREGAHPYSANNLSTSAGLIDPIWEYDHDLGRSITGGLIYRGKKVPELAGHYLYADYVSGRLWALHYDTASRRVIANRTIAHEEVTLPVVSFGEDEAGEAYFTVISPTGQGIYTFQKKN